MSRATVTPTIHVNVKSNDFVYKIFVFANIKNIIIIFLPVATFVEVSISSWKYNLVRAHSPKFAFVSII